MIRPLVTLLVLSALLMGCETRRIPETCIFFDAKEDQSKFIRDGAARIAASRRMDFSDKSGQYPWPDLAIYIGLEGRGFHVVGHREKGYVGTLCFYEVKGIFSGEKAREQMKLVQADFSAFFTDAKIPTGKGRPYETKSGTGDTPMGPPFVVLWLPSHAQVANASDFEKLLRAEFANFAKAQGLEFSDSSVEQQQLQSREHLVWLMAYEKRVSLLVDWGGDSLYSNMVAVNGDRSAERPRQIYEALVRHLRATNIPFTVEAGTGSRVKGAQ